MAGFAIWSRFAGHPGRSAKTRYALRLKSDHSIGAGHTPFYITRNELEVADDRQSEWCLFRLYEFSTEPKGFELYPPLDAHVSLTALTYQAGFH